MVDMLDYYGTETIERSTGEVTRYKVFDRPFNDGEGRVAGQEDVQVAIHRTFSNFAREGRVNKVDSFARSKWERQELDCSRADGRHGGLFAP